MKDAVPDWFLDDCLSALTTGELFSLVEQMDGMVILPLYLYDHSGITMNTCGFSCPWDSGQVGWIYASAMDSSFSRKMWRWIAAGDSWGKSGMFRML